MKKMSYLNGSKPLNSNKFIVGTHLAQRKFVFNFDQGVKLMTKSNEMTKCKKTAMLLLGLSLGPVKTVAQNYNFSFYNGDVTEQAEKKVEPPKEVVQPADPVPESPQVISQEETPLKKKKDEKLKRTGISFLAGYSQNSFRDTGGLFNNIGNKILRAGISFVSSYDFNLDVEFLSNSIDADISPYGLKHNLSGRIPGLGIGVRNNYWIIESVGISLGLGLKGAKGTLSSSEGDYYYKSYGALLNAGPTFQIGRAQILLSYEYGVDHVQLDSKNSVAYNNKKWIQNSALKGMLSYRF